MWGGAFQGEAETEVGHPGEGRTAPPSPSTTRQLGRSMARNRGLKQALLEYMTRNVDRPVTLDELDRELSHHSRGSISSTMSSLCRNEDYPAESLGAGVYRWSSSYTAANGGITPKDLMEVILVNEKDGKKVLLRDDHGGMWVARQVDLEEMM